MRPLQVNHSGDTAEDAVGHLYASATMDVDIAPLGLKGRRSLA